MDRGLMDQERAKITQTGTDTRVLEIRRAVKTAEFQKQSYNQDTRQRINTQTRSTV